MKKHVDTASPLRSTSAARRTRAAALALALSTFSLTGLLAGCESALQHDDFSKSWGGYAQSVLARNVADGSLDGSLPVNTLPINQGVHEHARIDSPGPGGASDAVTPDGSTTTPPHATPGDMVTTLPGALGLAEPSVKLTLQEAIARAMKQSLAIKVEAYNPGIRAAQVIEAEAALDAVIFGQSQFTRQDEPQVQSFANGDITSWNNSVGVKKLFETGGTGQLTFGDNYANYNNPASQLTVNPSHTAYLNAELSQPLLRGFGTDVTNANIYLASKDSRIALNVFRRQVIQTVADVEDAYLQLVQYSATVDIQQRLLDNTIDSYNKIKAREKIDVDQVQISQSRSAVEQRKADLIRARTNVRNASDKLKQIMNDPGIDLRSNVLIVPVDRPVSQPISLNVTEQLDIALRQRSELAEDRLNIEKADIVLAVAKNDLLPKFDLVVSAQATGLDNGLDQAIYGGRLQADKYIDYAVGGKFEIPIGNRSAESNFRRRILERRQGLTKMLQTAQQVLFEVKQQIRELLTTYQEIQARSNARKSAFDELAAINTREAVGEKLDPTFLQLKLDSQQRLANAELAELQAIINYNIAIYKLEQAKGTLLEYERVSLDAAPITDPGEHKLRFLGATYIK